MPYVALNYANGELVANITGTNLSTDHVGSFLPSQWSSTNHSVLGSKEPTLLCNHLKS